MFFSQDFSEFSASTNSFSTVPPPGIQANAQKKPWLPKQECQFRCCHTCRPSLGERTYLSLNGIASGDIPPSAVTGFGFHVQRQRPVAPVQHVKNLGLRVNPPSVSPRSSTVHRCYSYIKASKTSSEHHRSKCTPRQGTRPHSLPKHRSRDRPRHRCSR
jgi:hypothetical protein